MNFQIPFWIPVLIVCVIVGGFLGFIVGSIFDADPSLSGEIGSGVGLAAGVLYILLKHPTGN